MFSMIFMTKLPFFRSVSDDLLKVDEDKDQAGLALRESGHRLA